MKKVLLRLIGAFAAFSLLVGFMPFAKAGAADQAFSDVPATQYYFTAVNAMYDQGIVNGCGAGTFLPQNPVKRSEALKMVCSMAGITCSGYSGKTVPWYSDIMAWAEDKGIIASGTDPGAYATRDEIGSYIVHIYKMSTDTKTDAFSDTHSAIANTLYDYGIISGIENADGILSFDGNAEVKRCDACVMLYRLSGKVGKPNWSSFVPEWSHYNVGRPKTFTGYDDYVQAWSYMLTNTVFADSYTVDTDCSKADIQDIMNRIQDAYNFAMFRYMEYASFLNIWEVRVEYSYDSGGCCHDPTFELTLSNSFGLSDADVKTEITAFNEKCGEIVKGLYGDGELKADMTDKDKALVLYRYMAYHMKYDNSCRYYNGYDAAVLGTAVCQGYTSMYNCLCNLAGVRMECMTGKINGDGHAWSRIEVGGSYYNVDCTWGDPVPDRLNYCDETFFWVSDSFLKNYSIPRTFDSDTLVYGE